MRNDEHEHWPAEPAPGGSLVGSYRPPVPDPYDDPAPTGWSAPPGASRGRCERCGEPLWDQQEAAEVAVGLVHVACMADGEEIA